MPLISIVSPCFNEEDNVAECHAVVKRIFEEHLPGYDRQHIFVDNASTDKTVEIIKEIVSRDSSVGLVVNSRNFGVFRSSFNGLRYAKGDAILVMLPVDLQDPPDLLPEFVRLWESGYDIVAGARKNRKESLALRSGRAIFYRIVNSLSDFELTPDVGELQLVDRKVLQAALSFNDQYPYIRGILASVGFKRIIIPYEWGVRERGLSKHSLIMMTDQALNAIFSFTRAPMRFCTFSGTVIAILSILFALLSAVLWLFNPDLAPRGTTTIIVALFLLSGIQLFFIGILGEYVTSIQAQVRGGPMVIERERVNLEAPETLVRQPSKTVADANG